VSEPDYRAAHRARSEQAALDGIVERLAQRFPELGRDEISKAVRGEYDEFRDSKVCDYVPIFVERHAQSELANAAPRQHLA
jgi:hypothetical protein